MQSNTEILQTVSKNVDFSAQKSTAEARHVSEHIVERRMSKPDSLGNQYVETETVTDRITDSNSLTDTETTAETTDTLTIKAHSSEDVKVKEEKHTEESPWSLLIVIVLGVLTWIGVKTIYSKL